MRIAGDLGEDISIHAPLAGRDLRALGYDPATAGYFNPRAPCGARQAAGGCQNSRPKISIHAPLAGRDEQRVLARLRGNLISIHAPLAGRDVTAVQGSTFDVFISIHAPLAGRDHSRAATRPSSCDFNPRAPCGARQQKRTKIFLRFCDNRQISADFSANHRLSKRFTSAFQKKRGRFPVRSSRQFSARLRFARDDHCHSERSITPSACRSRRTGDALRPR